MGFENEPVPKNACANKQGYFVFKDGSKTETVIIPDYVTSISSQAFISQATRLRSVFLPDNVKSIDSHAFLLCENLRDVVLSNGITEINKSTFAHCQSLKTITVPDSVTSIHDDAFTGSNPTFICSEGSYAERFAKEHGFAVSRSNEPKVESPVKSKTDSTKKTSETSKTHPSSENRKLMTENEKLRKEIAELKTRNKKLEKQINALKRTFESIISED